MSYLSAPSSTVTVSQKIPVNPKPKPQKTYYLLTFARPSLSTQWGLSLSLIRDRYLIVGDFDRDKLPSLLKSSWGSPFEINHHLFLDRQHPPNIPSITRMLLEQPPVLVGSSIQLGDCILAINGCSVTKFHALSSVTGYLRQCTEFTVLVVRDGSAATAAGLVWQMVWRGQHVSNPSYTAASAAARIWQTNEPQPVTNTSLIKASPPAVNASTPWEPVTYTNPLFHDDQGKPLPFVDNWEFDPEDGTRAHLFLPTIAGVPAWLNQRKRSWRQRYRIYPCAPVTEEELTDDECEREDCAVAVDFWSQQGYRDFSHWLAASQCLWQQRYSWNRRKRQRLERDSTEVVHVEDSFDEWLRVRKNQWRILRRKRQRQRTKSQERLSTPCQQTESSTKDSQPSPTSVVQPAALVFSPAQPELVLIDALLEKQERERKEHDERPALDISFFFDASLGCPDDTVAHILDYLDPLEYSKLLEISKQSRSALMKREHLWRLLCPSHWKLPRRPRKPSHELYFTNLRREVELSRKRWDDLLSRISVVLLKADQLQTVEKLVTDAERDYGFDVNYSSGVVCERNAILNLAVIHQRHKVVRWLVETKHADIETCDRGCFTPLLNAAWAGDKYLVRFLLQKGADRTKLGTCHYTKPLASPDFEGLTAAEWADKRGHNDIATLIRIGL